MAESLLDPAFLRRLDRLTLQTRRVLGGQIKGERLTRRKGVSVDFADYRHYVRGDDLRFIDWNIYGRLDRLFIKIFYEEQDLRCHILLDTSRSMAFGDPNKMEFAKKIAAAVGYVGLTNQDKVGITCFEAKTGEKFEPSRGRHHVRRMMGFLHGLEPSGETSLEAACSELSQRVRGPGIVILISDFLDPSGFEPALRLLVRENIDVYVFQVLAPQELDPSLQGHLELHDLETGQKVEVTINRRVMEVYKRNVEAYCTMIQDYCTKYGMSYSLVSSDLPLEDLFLRQLRNRGLMKA